MGRRQNHPASLPIFPPHKFYERYKNFPKDLQCAQDLVVSSMQIEIPYPFKSIFWEFPLLLYFVPLVMRNRIMQGERLLADYNRWKQVLQRNFPFSKNRRWGWLHIPKDGSLRKSIARKIWSFLQRFPAMTSSDVFFQYIYRESSCFVPVCWLNLKI